MKENRGVHIWDSFVGYLVAALFALAQVYGGSLGLAIITLSLSVRIALLPFTLQLARHAQASQRKLHALQPRIDAIRAKYGSDRQRLNAELFRLFRRHGYNPISGRTFFGGLAQLPIGIGLYTAISRGIGDGGRFLWILNLARPDVILALLTGALTYLASVLSPEMPQQVRIVVTLVPALMTVYFVWNLASGVGLYWATSSTVGVLQSALMRRSPK
jgi:YidC/Oxa1 family membrane protein insertase